MENKTHKENKLLHGWGLMMTRVLALLFATTLASTFGQGTLQYVVPNGLASVAGNASSSDLFVNGIGHLTQVYSASQFNIGSPSGRIDALSFRLESGSPNFSGVWPSVAVGMATTQLSPDSLSPVFSDNFPLGAQRVYASTLSIHATNSAVDPRTFEIRIVLQTSFFYAPASGNLLVDVISFGNRSLALDAQFASGDGVSRVWANPDNTIGTVDTLGLVTQFDVTAVPEPGSSWIVLPCVAVLVLRNRCAGPTRESV